ncbi:hypothetical protein SLA2020_366080 [Shorea laevis]
MVIKKMDSILRFLGLIIILLNSSLLCMAQAKVLYYNFVLKEAKFTKLCSTKSILTVNGTFPGPTIRVNKGDTAFVNVYNQGKYGQPKNPWSDGPENITQCPIRPGKNFTQEIIFSNEEGTLWWHAHSDWTRATVHGAIIISPAPKTTYPFSKPDAEETLILGQWYKGDVMNIINTALATGADPNLSDAFTINGQPGDLYKCSNATTYRLNVVKGQDLSSPDINSIMNEEQFFGIAKHKLTLVATDAAYTKQITTDYLMISPGQTMDVLLTANQTPSLYYIASTPFADAATAPFDNTTATAILQYNGTYKPPSSIPFPTLPSYNNETAAESFTKRLRSLASNAYTVNVPKSITKQILITVSINQIYCPNASCSGPEGNKLAASLNNITFQTPTIDILQAYYSHLPKVFTNDFPNQPPHYFNFTGDVGNNTIYPILGTKALIVNYNDSVEIVFQGTNVGTAENHPLHLHGYSFYVVGTGSGNFNKKTDPKSYNLNDPPEVNTIGVPKNGWVSIRFIADNPVGNFSCTKRMGPPTPQACRPPPQYMPPCSKS